MVLAVRATRIQIASIGTQGSLVLILAPSVPKGVEVWVTQAGDPGG